MLKARQRVLAHVDNAKSQQKHRIAMPVPLWLWKEILRVSVTPTASEQVLHLLLGWSGFFIFWKGVWALVATHKKCQAEMWSLGHRRAGKQIYHLYSVCCGAWGLKDSFVQPPGELQEEGASPATVTKTLTKHSFRGPDLAVPSDAASDLLGCPSRDHFPACAPHPPRLTLLLHNATRRAWVEYYIPERKGNAQAEKTRLWWRTLPFHHRAPCVPADNRPLCSPIS